MKFALRTKWNMKFNQMTAVLKSDCFLASRASNVIGCYSNKALLFSKKRWSTHCTKTGSIAGQYTFSFGIAWITATKSPFQQRFGDEPCHIRLGFKNFVAGHLLILGFTGDLGLRIPHENETWCRRCYHKRSETWGQIILLLLRRRDNLRCSVEVRSAHRLLLS